MTSVDPRRLLREAGIRPKKSFGQNFLVAPPTCRAIAAACVADEELGRARVVEIGAGTGALTSCLAERSRSVVAIERDHDLLPLLKRAVACDHVHVIEGEAQSIDLRRLLGDADASSPRVLCGNLPYAITGLLLRQAIDHAGHVERVVFLVQKEVADRLAAAPGDENWGALTVFARAAYDVRRLLRVPPGAFYPSPEVTSALVELVPQHPRRAQETDAFRALVRAAFDARRKTLRNAWAGLAPDAATLERAASRAGVNLQARGETLDVDAFAKMAEALGQVEGRQGAQKAKKHA